MFEQEYDLLKHLREKLLKIKQFLPSERSQGLLIKVYANDLCLFFF